uniref:AGL13 protein n=1 Tax=Fopius arisanus TaxID=64838 RepID=A0A0C9PVI6_9HYME
MHGTLTMVFTIYCLITTCGVKTFGIILFIYSSYFKIFWCFFFSVVVMSIFVIYARGRDELKRTIVNGEPLEETFDELQMFEEIRCKLTSLTADLKSKGISIHAVKVLAKFATGMLARMENDRRVSANQCTKSVKTLMESLQSMENEVKDIFSLLFSLSYG